MSEKSLVMGALALQRATNTLFERFEEKVSVLVSRARVLEEASHLGAHWGNGGSQVPDEEVVIRVVGHTVTLSGWRWRGDLKMNCSFSMPFDYADGSDDFLRETRERIANEAAAIENKKLDAAREFEENERAEYERLREKFEGSEL